MPVHIFISMCNILAGQFKKEAEKQKKDQDEAMADMPNLRSFSDISSIASSLNLPNINIPNNISIPGL